MCIRDRPASVRNFTDLKALRAAALYGEDDAKAIRKSHENPLLKKVYLSLIHILSCRS